MNILDALKTSRPLRRTCRGTRICGDHIALDHVMSPAFNPENWYDPEYLLSTCVLDKEDMLATDWEVKAGPITCNAAKLHAEISKQTHRKAGTVDYYEIANAVFKAMGWPIP